MASMEALKQPHAPRASDPYNDLVCEECVTQKDGVGESRRTAIVSRVECCVVRRPFFFEMQKLMRFASASNLPNLGDLRHTLTGLTRGRRFDASYT